MLCGTIPSGDAAIMFLADALSRERALTETESRVLQRAVRRDAGWRKSWTKQEDEMLHKMRRAGLSSVQMGEKLHRSPEAVRQRLCQLRKAGKV